FVIEAGSSALQILSFKLTGKRIFKIAPLHHHFQFLGLPETKITLRFWIVAAVLAVSSLALLKARGGGMKRFEVVFAGMFLIACQACAALLRRLKNACFL